MHKLIAVDEDFDMDFDMNFNLMDPRNFSEFDLVAYLCDDEIPVSAVNIDEDNVLDDGDMDLTTYFGSNTLTTGSSAHNNVFGMSSSTRDIGLYHVFGTDSSVEPRKSHASCPTVTHRGEVPLLVSNFHENILHRHQKYQFPQRLHQENQATQLPEHVEQQRQTVQFPSRLQQEHQADDPAQSEHPERHDHRFQLENVQQLEDKQIQHTYGKRIKHQPLTCQNVQKLHHPLDNLQHGEKLYEYVVSSRHSNKSKESTAELNTVTLRRSTSVSQPSIWTSQLNSFTQQPNLSVSTQDVSFAPSLPQAKPNCNRKLNKTRQRFVDLQSMYGSTKYHTGSVTCSLCGISCKNKGNLKNHMKTHWANKR